ncbi:MAG: gliding-motility protein MglA [Candidatus Eisenbacteria bacterium]|uniref:Gliding-motility protein MglA n=1 Tax=Eiseniibacteriota bacterium TaxID=2212470 RepID=A0A938BR65_UNCEI|nr:gliding-motility protein MglA [Candidatus Eisenbacteria bacterium]
MAFIHAAKRELHCKIVYYGPGLGGKTTNLVWLHGRLPAAGRSDLVSLQTPGERTLYFDFLPLDVGVVHGLRTRFHLYTVPGQPIFKTTRRLVLQGADGLVFVADSDRSRLFDNRQSLDDLRENLARGGRRLEGLPLVFQFNKRDLAGCAARGQLEQLLNAAGRPVIEAVATRGAGVPETLRAVVSGVLARLAEPRSAQRRPA